MTEDSRRLLGDDPLYCDACGKLMTREDIRDSPCPTLCIDCCNTIDRDTEEQLETTTSIGSEVNRNPYSSAVRAAMRAPSGRDGVQPRRG